jgi:hypothetical protein
MNFLCTFIMIVNLISATLISGNFAITQSMRDSFQDVNKEIKMDESYAFSQMQLGASYAYSLLVTHDRSKIPTGTQEDYLKSLIALIWFFYSQALDRKQPFDSGVFLIQDDSQLTIYNFFMDYVKRFGKDISGVTLKGPVKKTLQGTIADPALHASFNKFAYPRDSSHYNESQKKYRQYGIEVRLGPKGNEMPLLPGKKKHILFGIVDGSKYLIFFKPEDNGLYYSEGLIGHVKGYFESKLRQLGLTEKSNEDRFSRRERIPKQFISDFKAIVNNDASLPKTVKEDLIKRTDQEGIKILYTQNLAQKPEYKSLVDTYSKEYDHLDLRMGREIILTTPELIQVLSK